MASCALGLLGVLMAVHTQQVPLPQRQPPTLATQSMTRGGSEVVVLRAEADIEVWIDLSLEPLARIPRAAQEQRAAQRARIRAQQDEVMGQLATLGAVELARVQQVRNALAVRLPAAALARARSIPGVRNVRPVTHIQRDDS